MRDGRAWTQPHQTQTAKLNSQGHQPPNPPEKHRHPCGTLLCMQSGKKTRSPTIFSTQGNLYQRCPKMAPALWRPHAAPHLNTLPHKETEYNPPLSKADLDASLTTIYEKLVDKIQLELHKSTNALSQEIAAIGGRTDILETKHDELALAHNDLRKDCEMLADNFSCRLRLKI